MINDFIVWVGECVVDEYGVILEYVKLMDIVDVVLCVVVEK